MTLAISSINCLSIYCGSWVVIYTNQNANTYCALLVTTVLNGHLSVPTDAPLFRTVNERGTETNLTGSFRRFYFHKFLQCENDKPLFLRLCA